ncbi:MAG TPA: hypothetical protein VND95_17740 [Stellaceae bacterium]|nr:hypothetical protein [Stellaceae bacterium]
MLVLVLLPLLPTLALADWQNTKWGMAVSQVSAATGAHSTTADERANWRRGDNLPLLSMDYVSGNLRFKDLFYFPKLGGLKFVELHLEDYTKKVDLINALIGKYGPPIEKHESDVGMSMRWLDKPDNLLIGFVDLSIISDASVIYNPASNQSSSGL